MNVIRKFANRFLITSVAIAIVMGIGYYFFPVSEQDRVTKRNSLYWFVPTDLDFAQPDYRRLVFPEDHGNHRKSGIETWELIGSIETKDAGRFGFDATFTRLDLDGDPSRRKSVWATNQIFHLDYAIIPLGKDEPYRDRETARQAMGLAGYDRQQRTIRVYRRTLRFEGTSPQLPKLELTIPDGAYPAKLNFTAVKPLVIPSFSAPFRYYIASRMKVEGRLKASGQDQPVSGQAFFDHIWGNLPIGSGQLVRNRFILQLSNNIELSLLQLRRRDGSGKAIETGFIISAASKMTLLGANELHIEASGHWTSRSSGVHYPVSWRIRIPGKAIALDLISWRKNQETGDVPINWSGMVSVSGHADSLPVGGFGYVQLSGYALPEDR